MKLNSIIIENLFEIFNYNISFKPNENILIITGPNGFGKTMILNIIHSFFNKNILFLQNLVFDKITFCFDENIQLTMLKIIEKDKLKIKFIGFENGVEIEKGNDVYLMDILEMKENVRRASWEEYKRTTRFQTIKDALDESSGLFPPADDIVNKNMKEALHIRINEILNSIQVYLIKEQRLLKEVKNIEKNNGEAKEQTVMIETIQTYSEELRQLISEFSQKSLNKIQELDSSYPKRLTTENNILNQEEYEKKYAILRDKQKKLTEFGLYETEQEALNYNTADAKALSVYLKDLEAKIGVFDDLLEKLELFTNILNERRFTFKSININRKGFYFKTSKGKELELSQLSSGEQHEIVLLYELIFNVKPNSLVLIDEPEISLHVTWQKEFLNDLMKIIKIQNIQVIIATHSPAIINDRWDLVHTLKAN